MQEVKGLFLTKAGLKTSISNTSKTYEWLSNMKQNDKPYKCGYCGSSYVREKTLFAHMCKKKRMKTFVRVLTIMHL